MAITHFARKEIKYRLTEPLVQALMERIGVRLTPSPYYFSEINNLYLDTEDYQLIRASMAKPVYKEKLRIRSYGNAKEAGVFYEIKKKYKGVVYKRRFRVRAADLRDSITLPLQFYPEQFVNDAQIVKEWNYCTWLYPELKPRYYIGYDRHAWVGVEDPDFRITFDRNLRWRDSDLALNENRNGKTLLENEVLMEVKVPGAMPLWMSAALSDLSLFPTSFSKVGEAYTHHHNEAQFDYEMQEVS